VPKLSIFRDGWRVGLRVTRPDHERGCDTGAAVSLKIGIGLFAPEFRVEWGAWYRSVWTNHRTGKRIDLGEGFERGEWINPYGMSGRRWDRVIRIALMIRRHRREAAQAAAAEIESIPF